MIENMTPKNRKEAFLDDIAGGDNGLSPKTREEYYLSKIKASGGGSGDGLPEYSIGDAHKVLTIVPEQISRVIVQEQTLTITAEDVDGVSLANPIDMSDVTPETPLYVTINNEEYTCYIGDYMSGVTVDAGPNLNFFISGNNFYAGDPENDYAVVPGVYTVAVSIDADSQTDASVRWAAANNVLIVPGYSNPGGGVTLAKTYGEIIGAFRRGISVIVYIDYNYWSVFGAGYDLGTESRAIFVSAVIDGALTTLTFTAGSDDVYPSSRGYN